MTDHKAEWVLVPRVPTAEMLHIGKHAAPYRAADVYAAMIAAAPAASEATINSDGIDSRLIGAASEGEDGAVATLLASDPYDETCSKGPWMDTRDWERLRAMPPGTKLYTRPAAQVAATPKHDEGREVESVERLRIWAQGLISQLPCTHEGRNSWLLNYGVGEESDWLRAEHARYSKEWANWRAGEPTPEMRRYPDPALATQAAARRVTQQDVWAALAAYLKAPDQMAAIRAALESFAQPAEGVSGG